MQKNNANGKIEYKAIKIWDLAIYALVLILAVCLFLCFTPSVSASTDGFKIQVNGKDAFFFYYDKDAYTVTNGYDVKVTKKDGGYIVTVNTDKGFNTLEVDSVKKQVKVIDSNCSLTKDCVYFLPLTGSTGAIICVPHDLVITPLGDGFIPPVAG